MIGGVAVAIYFSASEEVFQSHIVEVNGLIGSEKSDFFDDPRIPVISLKPRLLLYLYDAPHIGSASLALLGLGLYFAGVIKSFWCRKEQVSPKGFLNLNLNLKVNLNDLILE